MGKGKKNVVRQIVNNSIAIVVFIALVFFVDLINGQIMFGDSIFTGQAFTTGLIALLLAAGVTGIYEYIKE